MSPNRSDRGETERLALDALAPRRGWVEGLPSLAREAASRRRERASWAFGFASAGRWVIPAAMAMAVACWMASIRAGPPGPNRSALLLAGSDGETLAALALSGRR